MRTIALILSTTFSASSALAAPGSLTWIGGPTAVIERGVKVLTDPMLGPRSPSAFVLPKHPSTGEPNAAIARYLNPAPVELGDLDAVLLSHAHNDHVDDTAKRRLPKSIRMVLPPSAVEPMRAAGFTNMVTLDWGETTKIERGKSTLEITAVPAHHAHDPALDAQIGRGNGWLLRFTDPAGRYVLYVSGDAVLAPEMATATKAYGAVDLFVPHLGGVAIDKPGAQRTMNAAEALTAFGQMDARMMLPIHHTTFGHYREPIEALREQALEAKVERRVMIVPTGVKTPLPSAR